MEQKRNTLTEPGKVGTAEWLRREEARRRHEQGQSEEVKDDRKPANPTGVRTK